ncbi:TRANSCRIPTION REPRESSOR OFP7-RELATED [Salix purpurea]|uniref:Transcription repressor n=1 Tax=Salix purpurea TaxID=77065 RepID=A0A9Q0VXD4_SALPP|nr:TRANSCRIPTION REPRESSOR OFP7-RELATED [Salix purpurea]
MTTNQSRDEHEYHDTPSTFSPSMDTPPYFSSDTDNSRVCPATVRGFGRVGAESVAVEKDSDDPYLDFRQSMLQMVLEKQIYSKDDLRQLLDCFLQLNSPYYHGIIVRAFHRDLEWSLLGEVDYHCRFREAAALLQLWLLVM